MTTADEWRDLARRCKEAKIPDVEIDAEICIAAQYTGTDEKGIVSNVRVDPDFSDDDLCFAVDGVDDCCNRVPELTISIDAIVALIEKTLLGECWRAESAILDFSPAASIGTVGPTIFAASPALALCAAYCEARAAIEDAARVNGAAAERSGE